MNVLTRGIRNAFRNVIRTTSIVVILGLSIGLSLSMLIARQAVSDKIASVKSSMGTTVSITPAGIRGFEGGGEALTKAQVAAATALPHVRSVSMLLSDRLDTTNTDLESAVAAGSLGQRFSERNGQVFSAPPTMGGGPGTPTPVTRSFTPPVIVTGTTDPNTTSAALGGGTFSLKEGELFSADSTQQVAIIGKGLAEKNNLNLGATFTAYGTTITVSGIFDAGNTFANNQVVMPLATVQTLSGQAGNITSAIATVDSISNVASVTDTIQDKLDGKADVTNALESAEEAIAPLENIRTIALYSLIGAVTAGAAIILLVMVMIVRERRREIGVLKAIGASNVRVVGQFMSEAVTLTSLGAVLGIALGVLAADPITQLLVDNSSDNTPMGGPGAGPLRAGGLRVFQDNVTTVTASVGWDIILYGIAAAILIGVIGSVVASFFIAKVRPAEVMRAD
ncbi:MAG TPA: FtsX-like permease family protein [Candidatus Saccharimonadales bacterium]|nr:FtsX-like permease family protein [Candidatus Saccharimonadales bacterium]